MKLSTAAALCVGVVSIAACAAVAARLWVPSTDAFPPPRFASAATTTVWLGLDLPLPPTWSATQFGKYYLVVKCADFPKGQLEFQRTLPPMHLKSDLERVWFADLLLQKGVDAYAVRTSRAGHCCVLYWETKSVANHKWLRGEGVIYVGDLPIYISFRFPFESKLEKQIGAEAVMITGWFAPNGSRQVVGRALISKSGWKMAGEGSESR